MMKLKGNYIFLFNFIRIMRNLCKSFSTNRLNNIENIYIFKNLTSSMNSKSIFNITISFLTISAIQLYTNRPNLLVYFRNYHTFL